MASLRDISQLIDHALLHPALTDAEILQGCEVAKKYDVKTVCVKPHAIPLVKQALKGSPVLICAVVGFPHGNSMASVKLRETQEALAAGAAEIDMVINIGKAVGGQYDYIKEEVRAVQRACQRTGMPLKVIFENDFLQDEHIIELCKICTDLTVAFVKTSTGFGFVKQANGDYNYQGATELHVKLMRQYSAAYVKIKASGGIKTLDDLLKFRDLGCARIGTSGTEAIMEEARQRGLC